MKIPIQVPLVGQVQKREPIAAVTIGYAEQMMLAVFDALRNRLRMSVEAGPALDKVNVIRIKVKIGETMHQDDIPALTLTNNPKVPALQAVANETARVIEEAIRLSFARARVHVECQQMGGTGPCACLDGCGACDSCGEWLGDE